MAAKVLRAVIVGASSVLGKELAEQLSQSTSSVWDLTLVDAEDAGQLTAAGDEALMISALDAATFEGADVVFFAGDAETTRARWREARSAGAAVVDLTRILVGEENVRVLAPRLGATKADLKTVAAVPAHPAAVTLAEVLSGLHKLEVNRAAATVLEPVSQHGSAAMNELQQQAISLLSFQSVPTEVFGAQLAFNLRDEWGAESGKVVRASEEAIRHDLGLLLPKDKSIALQVVAAPVFHGTSVSMWVEANTALKEGEISEALSSERVLVKESGAVDLLEAAGQGAVLVRVREEADGGAWLWMAVDNIYIAAQTAVACAQELLALRPVARPQ